MIIALDVQVLSISMKILAYLDARMENMEILQIDRTLNVDFVILRLLFVKHARLLLLIVYLVSVLNCLKTTNV